MTKSQKSSVTEVSVKRSFHVGPYIYIVPDHIDTDTAAFAADILSQMIPCDYEGRIKQGAETSVMLKFDSLITMHEKEDITTPESIEDDEYTVPPATERRPE